MLWAQAGQVDRRLRLSHGGHRCRRDLRHLRRHRLLASLVSHCLPADGARRPSVAVLRVVDHFYILSEPGIAVCELRRASLVLIYHGRSRHRTPRPVRVHLGHVRACRRGHHVLLDGIYLLRLGRVCRDYQTLQAPVQHHLGLEIFQACVRLVHDLERVTGLTFYLGHCRSLGSLLVARLFLSDYSDDARLRVHRCILLLHLLYDRCRRTSYRVLSSRMRLDHLV